MTNSYIENMGINLLNPSQIKSLLDKYVIGQTDAKKVLSIAIYNHYKRLIYNKYNSTCNENGDIVQINDIEIEKSNVLLLGESGSGKTLLCKTIAKMIDIPFTIADATTLTEAGYVGDDVETIISRLFQASNYNIEKTEMGIVYIDEIDKISRKSENPSITRDVSGEGVQQALLKLVEGATVYITPNGGRKHPNAETIPINTSNILFIAGGAFSGIENKIKNRINTHSIGFDASSTVNNDNDLMSHVMQCDLKAYGIIPELIGRFPIITHTNKLSLNDYIDILTKPKNAIIKQYIELIKMDGGNISFSHNALKEMANIAIKIGVGARGLRSVVEVVLRDILYNGNLNNNKNFTINANYVKSKTKSLTLN